MPEYIVYHGTNSAFVDSIKENGFKSSASKDDWLGFGVYFFTEGAFCPITSARDWAICNAWNKKKKQNMYENYTILQTMVSGDKVLDLRLEEDLKIYDTLRQKILNKFEIEKNKFKHKLTPETFLCNSISESLKLDIMIQNFYIKTKFQRVNYIHSNIANTTVLCAKNSASIKLTNIKEIEKEGINDE